MSVQKGKGVMWSIGAVAMTGYVNHWQSISFERSAQKTEIIDNTGEVSAQIFSQFKKMFSGSLTPSSTTLILAKGEVDLLGISPGLKIIVTDGSTTLGRMAGNYNLISSSQKRSDSGVVTFDIVLEGPDGGFDFTVLIA